MKRVTGLGCAPALRRAEDQDADERGGAPGDELRGHREAGGTLWTVRTAPSAT